MGHRTSRIPAILGYAFAPEVFVTSVDDDGFTLCFKNIPETLDVNFLAM